VLKPTDAVAVHSKNDEARSRLPPRRARRAQAAAGLAAAEEERLALVAYQVARESLLLVTKSIL